MKDENLSLIVGLSFQNCKNTYLHRVRIFRRADVSTSIALLFQLNDLKGTFDILH